MGRTLTQLDLNRALLARQGLLERLAGPIPAVLERVGGLQAQYAPSMYVGLWSRAQDVRRDELTALLERSAVVQGTLMRSTIHVVAAADYWPFALGVRRARRRQWARSVRGGPTAGELAGAARVLRRRLAHGPLLRREVEALVGRERARYVGLWLDLLRVPPLGTWERRRADLYALAEDRLGPPDTTPARGLEHLVRRYLQGHGPATPRDVALWAGTTVADLAPALRRLELERHRGPAGEELLDLPGAPLPGGDVPAPVRFLPTWDATLLVHARRTLVLPEAHRPRVFSTRNPQSTPTFLVDGAVAGAWRHEAGRVVLEPWERLDRAARRALDEEADRLAAFHA